MTILDKIILDKKKHIETLSNEVNVQQLEQSIYFQRQCHSMATALQRSPTGIISEFKRRSPSQGWIHRTADPKDIAVAYEKSGASAISILTDTPFFGGNNADILQVRDQIQCPILRKDFIIDEYQVIEAKSIGADAILLIAATLPPEKCKALAQLAKSIGLEVLLEVHNQDELRHINEYVDVVGVNNRNLKTFQVDTQISKSLSTLIPDAFVKISESGIKSPETVLSLREYGYRGFLMGETFMKTTSPALALSQFIKSL